MIHIRTIPHTGTRFVCKFFRSLGFKDIRFATQPASSMIKYFSVSHFPQKEHGELQPSIIVTTLRDPCLVAISNLRLDLVNEWKGMELKRLTDMYDLVIKRAAQRKFIYFNIDCPKEKREAHLIGVLKALNIYDDSQRANITTFAQSWQPIGEYALDCQWKIDYETTGTLPDEIPQFHMQRAINWYNLKLRECIYDNLTS